MSASGVQTWADTWADLRRSFSDFLVVPASTIAVFLLLALGTYALDSRDVAWLAGMRAWLDRHLLSSEAATETLLSTLAGGMITITSITFSLLLLAVQQSASSLTTQVLDQFIRRRLNQWYFGVFVGVTLFTLVTQATNSSGETPVFSAFAALVLTCSALVLLIFLLYTTLNQMRANRIIESIHDLALGAREHQQELLARTRRVPQLATASVTRVVRSNNNGYFANLHIDRIGKVVSDSAACEITLLISIGDYVCFHDVIAEVRAASDTQASALEHAVLHAVDLERQRNLPVDPAYGVIQLGTIGWTSTSTARSNPSPALACVRNLRDLVARWSVEQPAPPRAAQPIVYRDNLLRRAVDMLESIGVAASEAMQHRCATEVLLTFADLLHVLPEPLQDQAESVVRRLLSGLGDHVLTTDLDAALVHLADSLSRAGRFATEREVRDAHARMAQTIGELNSRDSRVSSSE